MGLVSTKSRGFPFTPCTNVLAIGSDESKTLSNLSLLKYWSCRILSVKDSVERLYDDYKHTKEPQILRSDYSDR